MIHPENILIGKENTRETRTWNISSEDLTSAREQKKLLRQKQKARLEEQNEQFRNLVNHNR